MSPQAFLERIKAQSRAAEGRSQHFSALTATWLLNLLLARRGRIHLLLQDDRRPLHSLLDEMGIETHQALEAAEIQHLLSDRAQRLQAARIRPGGRFARNLESLREKLGLTPLERDALGFLVITRADPTARMLIDALYPQAPQHALIEAISTGLQASASGVAACLRSDGVLRRAGLISLMDGSNFPFCSRLGIRTGLIDALGARELDLEDFLRDAMYPARPSRLAWEDFQYMQQEAELIRSRLAHAYQRRDNTAREQPSNNAASPGHCNVLLAGPPGTGKSEFARLMARELAADAWEIADLQPGDDASARTRDMSLAQEILAHAKRPLIIFDEIEDVFGRDLGLGNQDSADHSKGWMNRFLESNPVPTLWITNSVARIDPAHLRRFDLVIDMPQANKPTRERLVRRQLPEHLAETRLGRYLTRTPDITAADVEILARASQSLATSHPASTEASLERLLDHRLRVIHGQRYQPPHNDNAPYSLKWLNPDTDIEPIANGLARSRMGRILLHGPPGTGKTAFAHYLAERLDLPLVSKSAAQLLGCFVGENEQNVRRLFEQARREQGVLMLDEADSLVANREGTSQQWQVSLTNEILQQMETFPGIFIAATNRIDHLDPAAMRRFDWRIKLDWLKPEQVVDMARATLRAQEGQEPSEADLAQFKQIGPVAPGDFNVARRQALVRGIELNSGALKRVLMEQRRGRQLESPGMGFLALV
ncbi:SpoVK/Ycf46/Vps4 family AAA+-type ATPase [Natronospira proteinivora]|uniref:SpoVK/Ycf46/Vps4 family AAA+-type ATPase n=1 Tax=Natronospira proteinivora TaxID=1807133 RepID=A0ABT1G8R1_9GAMM|nr:ATP-binding protein [Natronospira proteinivora]MCP1727621.1 SpoVK/Ycf46/Vps4 family AAA+-type ATPase [Natronospira proteinivora]